MVDERVCTTELRISTSPPAAPHHPDLLFPLLTHSDDSAFHSISLPASSFTLVLGFSLLLPPALSCLENASSRVSTTAFSLSENWKSELGHNQKLVVQIHSQTPTD